MLLYPGKKEEIERLWQKAARGTAVAGREGLGLVCRRLKDATDRYLESIDWTRYGLIGFSICLGQLTGSLYFMHAIRERAPSAAIVAGGSACAGAMGQSLLRTFPMIDFVVSGEGEQPLAHLARPLLRTGRADAPPHPGLFARKDAGEVCDCAQIADLDALPLPDYGDYFASLERLPPAARFIPELPVEVSRGCWWRGSATGGGDRGCRFCNLNLQWRGYRAKSPDRAVREIDELTRRHRVLSVPLMDNLLPARSAGTLFTALARLPQDLRLFGEIRATTPVEDLRAMAAAGMDEVQVGIESLSTALLRKIGKGTTVIRNLEIMKRCEAPDMPALAGNLILHVPGSDEDDASETLRTLDFAACFRPLKAVPFWLGFGSPIQQFPRSYGIQRIFNHAHYRRLFPAPVLKTLVLMIQGYHGGVRRQHRIWRPVRDRVLAWQRAYESLHSSPRSGPILSFRDGGTFLIIRQRGLGGASMTHRLESPSREVYLFCDKSRSLPRILARFPRLGEDRLCPFLRMMVEKRLMYEEGDRYLSLAVRLRGNR
ncbi:MAG: RiPP maturation radical SAM C-methyltransferase [Deltaproteobacteria bacterium]|nr:RiPP maturation radical SAM C-methyltransferase [Deltaproteobacteria bacterium]